MDIVTAIFESSFGNTPGYQTTSDVFGRSFPDEEELRKSPCSIVDPYLANLENFSRSTNMPNIIQNIYHRLGNNEREIVVQSTSNQDSYYTGEWTFMSLKEIEKRAKNNLYDFATTYLGMGHIMVLSWRKSDSMCFYRWAAGSNGYDRMIADSFINKFDPDVGSYILKIYRDDSWIDDEPKNLDMSKNGGHIFTAVAFFNHMLGREHTDDTYIPENDDTQFPWIPVYK